MTQLLPPSLPRPSQRLYCSYDERISRTRLGRKCFHLFFAAGFAYIPYIPLSFVVTFFSSMILLDVVEWDITPSAG